MSASTSPASPVVHFLETLLRDARFGLRQLRKSPSFTIAAVATLAVAIGANAVVFGVVNGFILRPLGVPREESLYYIERTNDRYALESYPNYLDLRGRQLGFERLAAFYYDEARLDSGATSTRASLYQVSGNYFDVVGIQPYLGRFFTASDEQGTNSAPYIVLTYAYWHAHYHDDPDVVGRTVQIRRHPYTIIGVAPKGVRGTAVIFSVDFFVPIVNQEQIDGSNLLNQRGNRWLTAFGHLKPGVTQAQAVADLNRIGSELDKANPNDNDKTSSW